MKAGFIFFYQGSAMRREGWLLLCGIPLGNIEDSAILRLSYIIRRALVQYYHLHSTRLDIAGYAL